MKVTLIKKICQVFKHSDFMKRWGHLLEGSDVLRNIIVAGENCKHQFRYQKRRGGVSGRKKNDGLATIDDSGEMSEDDIYNFASAVRGQEFVQRIKNKEGAEQEIKRSRRGLKSYNAREYAKHINRVMDFKKLSKMVYFLTVTAPTGFTDEGKEMSPREFCDKIAKALNILCRRGCGFHIVAYQPQKNGRPHCHIMIFVRNDKDSAWWETRFENQFRWAGSTAYRKVSDEDFKQTFDYLHYYTKYSAEDYLTATEKGDAETMEKASKSLRIIAWGTLHGIQNFTQSGNGLLKELCEPKMTEKQEPDPEPMPTKEEKAESLEEWEAILDNFIESGEKCVDSRTAYAVMMILETIFPCVNSPIKGVSEGLPTQKKQKTFCNCLLKEIYWEASAIYWGDAAE